MWIIWMFASECIMSETLEDIETWAKAQGWEVKRRESGYHTLKRPNTNESLGWIRRADRCLQD